MLERLRYSPLAPEQHGEPTVYFGVVGFCFQGGAEFRNVNIMGVAHGTDRELVLQHKAAIDAHLKSIGIPMSYTNVFWGGRSEIKPSEISPFAYREWCISAGLDPEKMKG